MYLYILIIFCILLASFYFYPGFSSIAKESLNFSYKSTFYQTTMKEALDIQMTKSPKDTNNFSKIAKKRDVAYYMNPNNFIQFSPYDDHLAIDKVIITASNSLNVRKGPATSYDVVGYVYNGDIYDVLERKDGWCNIDFNVTSGWISSSYTQILDLITSEEISFKTIKILSDNVNVRNKNNSSSDILTQVNKDEIYISLENSDGWYKINTDEHEGWVNCQHVESINNVPREMYQFLILSENFGVSSEDLDEELLGKGILEGLGQAFLDASIEYNINEIYLLSHALHETGHGTSSLSTGDRKSVV